LVVILYLAPVRAGSSACRGGAIDNLGRFMPSKKPVYHRVVLKISGEGLCEPGGFGIEGDTLDRISLEIQETVEVGAQVAVVVGGGNFFRGTSLAVQAEIPPATAHYMGMLATVINALALQEVLERRGLETRVQSSIAIAAVCESFIRRRCIRHLEKGRVVILGAGTGRPFVTTDTAAALAAVEVGADVVFKATKVDGVYSADPKEDPKAKMFTKLTHAEVLAKQLKVMDVSAIDLCQSNGVPIVVFNLFKPGNMRRAVSGETIGTTIAG
jgi:uridylate kinase